MSRTPSLVHLVCLVYFVCFVRLVYLIYLVCLVLLHYYLGVQTESRRSKFGTLQPEPLQPINLSSYDRPRADLVAFAEVLDTNGDGDPTTYSAPLINCALTRSKSAA